MDYRKIYFNLIAKRLKEPAAGSFEKHHILPKSVFGEGPIVKLTIREHLVAHKLLARIFPEGSKACLQMRRALFLMTHTRDGSRLSSREFESCRLANIELSRTYNGAKQPEVRKKISEKKKGRERSDMKGKRFMGASDEKIEEIKAKISKSRTGQSVNYPKNRKSREPNQKTFDAISAGRMRQLERCKSMTDDEVYSKLSSFKTYNDKGRLNSNIGMILKQRGESMEKYYDKKDGVWILKNKL